MNFADGIANNVTAIAKVIQLENQGVFIEEFGDGFIIADYSNKISSRFGARYRGIMPDWKDQPIGLSPFQTKEQAIKEATID